MSVGQCSCTDVIGVTTPHGFEFIPVRKKPSCAVHGKYLSKRDADDWTAIMGATPPNPAESSEKVGVTSTH